MKTIAEDKDTITIQFTRDEARNLASAADYIATLFEFLDREALDGYTMTAEDAERLANELSERTTAYLADLKLVHRA